MFRILFKLFCILNLIILNCVAEYDDTNFKDNPVYNPRRLYQRFHSSLSLKDKAPILANNLIFNPLNRDFVFESFEYLLQNSSKCVKDIVYTFENVGNFSNLWALQILDSFAKPPESGILIGNFKWIGDYNECIKVYAPPKGPGSTAGNFHGQYCSMTYNLPLFNKSVPLTFGICLPDSCSPKDLQDEIMQFLFKEGELPVINETSSVSNKSTIITCMPRERHLDAASIFVIALISFFCAFALMGSSMTVVKYFKKVLRERKGSSLIINISDKEHMITENDHEPKKSVESDVSLLQTDESNSNFEAFLNCFCVFTNGAKLLNTDSSEGQLLCIHGIRFLSMSWVILGHAYMFGFQETRNMAETVDVLDDFPFQVILQGFFSVDSFFVLSGFLLAYLSMKEFSKRKESINWLYFYIHRYVRLTPIYMVVLGFSATVFYYLGSGPFWPMGDYDPNCRKTWWWNLLYINNFVDQTEQCMGWSWYLANDMQFFVISPIFLISLWRWPMIGYGLLGLFLVGSMLSNFILTYHFDLMIGLVGIDAIQSTDTASMMLKFSEYFQKLYIKPYTRIGPYLVGIIAGYVLFKHKANNRPKLNWVFLSIGWIVASVVTLTCVYGLYHAHPSLIARCFYNAFNRTCFGCGLSWVIYVCLTKQSDIMNSILSYKLFIPLSRLTYAAYLIHPLILTGYFASLKRPFQFSHPSVVVIYLGFMVITYALALPVSLILESPIVSLEKVIRNKFNKVQNTGSRS